MKKTTTLTLAALAGLSLFAGNAIAPYGDVVLKGPVGDRLDRMIRNHLCATDTDTITAPFLEKAERRNWWQTEFWGKYMHSAVPFWTYSRNGELKRNIDSGVARIIGSQEACGYIGNYPDELRCGDGWDIWGMKYTMMASSGFGRTCILTLSILWCFTSSTVTLRL